MFYCLVSNLFHTITYSNFLKVTGLPRSANWSNTSSEAIATNQLTNQPTNQPTNQLTNQPTNQLTNQPTN